MTTSNEHNNVPAGPQEEGRPGIPLRKAYKHLLIVAPAQEVGLTDEGRADMACAVAAICTGASSRTVAATAIEWTERALRAKGGSHDA